MVEKGSEFPVGDPRRYFKYRVVFQGNRVKDQDGAAALFHDLASTPITLESMRCADSYGAFPGHTIQTRDVEQAYFQADLKGPPIYVVLPQELWTEGMHKMRCPVVRLQRALYGHKNSGVYWADYCQEQLEAAGFKEIKGHPSVYWDEDRKLLLTVYVDDMKISGPEKHMKEAWAQISDKITLAIPEGETGASDHTFLGCTVKLFPKTVRGKQVNYISCDMSASMRKSIAKYEQVVLKETGEYFLLYHTKAPFVQEDPSTSPHR